MRLTLLDDNTHDILWILKFSKPEGMVAVVTALFFTIAVIFCIIAFTPVNRLIPGFPDAHSRRAAIQNAIKVDSLESTVLRLQLYTENLARILEGEDPVKIDSIFKIQAASVPSKQLFSALSARDSVLRAKVADAEKFSITNARSRNLPIEGLHFFTPLKGVISQPFDQVLHPYVDITAPANSVVKSVLDGTVISAGWSEAFGHVIEIQHDGNMVSIYKRNQTLLKRQGDRVVAGDPIALLGNASSSAKSNHLHFELWHRGEAVNPVKYINF